MFYDRELSFLRETFKKNHISSYIVTPDTRLEDITEDTIISMLDKKITSRTIEDLLGKISPRTLYKHTDPIGLGFCYLSLPGDKHKTEILIIGPFINAPNVPAPIALMCSQMGIPQKYTKYIEEYYNSIPPLLENNPLFIMLDTFCEIIWKTTNYSFVDLSSESLAPVSPLNSDEENDILVNMRNIERRYAMENELMEAVTNGKLHRIKNLMLMYSESPFEKRLSDQLREAKNYAIILNTLLRKAAEQGGVHPMYLDKVSSSFALRIEQTPSYSNIKELFVEMFTSYCRLVKKHSMSTYSPIVQKVMVSIDADISADLSLSSLAAMQNVSAGYLCTLFKREVGKTLVEYIRERRMQHACHLLATTHMQVQTIALNCGMVDVQYFSKSFKRVTGKTPKEFREHAKNNAFSG